MATPDAYDVLLVEDSEHDVVAIRRAWKRIGLANELRVVRDGEECLDYLHRRGQYAAPGAAPRPGFLLLDLNLPKLDGLEVLAHVRGDADLRRLPIVMFTSSRMAEDSCRSYELGANAFVTKPRGLDDLKGALQTIHDFWDMAGPPTRQPCD
jgi:CheY-like chemotaxis protein